MAESNQPLALSTKAGLEYISIGCNCLHGVADWGQSGLVAYGAGHFVALYDVKARKVTQTLRAHKDRVNVVRWLNDHEIVSGSTDGTIIIWVQKDNLWVCTKVRLKLKNNLVCILI